MLLYAIIAVCGLAGLLFLIFAVHILVDETGQPMLFATAEDVLILLQTELKIMKPHIFNY